MIHVIQQATLKMQFYTFSNISVCLQPSWHIICRFCFCFKILMKNSGTPASAARPKGPQH